MIMAGLTASEVAALFDIDDRRMRKDVEYGVFGRMKSPPRFDVAEIVYFRIVESIQLDLTVEGRTTLYGLIAAAMRSKRAHDLGLGAYVVVNLAAAVREVETRLREFAKWKAKLVERDDILGGATVFPRTRLAVRHIGELVRRGAAAEISADYPVLSKQDVDFAARFVAAYPRIGRPRSDTRTR